MQVGLPKLLNEDDVSLIDTPLINANMHISMISSINIALATEWQ